MRCARPAWISGFRLGIETGGGLVQNENARIGQNRPGDGNSLFLTAGKLHAALADDGLVLVRKRFGEFIHARDAARRQNPFLAGIGPRKGHIFADGAVKQKRILQYDAQLRTIAVQPHGRKIDAVHTHHVRPSAYKMPKSIR